MTWGNEIGRNLDFHGNRRSLRHRFERRCDINDRFIAFQEMIHQYNCWQRCRGIDRSHRMSFWRKKNQSNNKKKNLTTAKKWVVSQSKRRDQDRRRHRPSIFECFRFVSLSFISLSLSLIRRFVPWRCGTWSSSLLFHAFFFGIGWLFVTFGCLLRCFFFWLTEQKEKKGRRRKKKRRHDAADWSAKAEWIESF